MSDLYDKVKEDIQFRRDVAERCRFGFDLPSFVPKAPICTQKEDEVVAV